MQRYKILLTYANIIALFNLLSCFDTLFIGKRAAA